MTERELLQRYVSTPAVQNALRVIRFAEGTERGGPDSYRVMFGGGLAPDLKRHPDKVIQGGGIASAAAGAYQFMPGTWQSQAKALGLSDFGPQSQDLAATRLLRNRLMPIGGLSTLEKEGFSQRVSSALAPEWASLPTESGESYYGQPVKKLGDLQKVFGQPQEAHAFGATPQLTKKQERKLKKQFQNPLGLPVSININLSGEEESRPEARSFLDTMKGQMMQSLFQQRPQFGLQEVLGLLSQ